MNIESAKIIVTGGGSGYGKGIAAALCAAGAKVWITGRNAAKLEAAARETGATPFVADVSSPADWDRLLAAVGDDLAVLVNNAGAGGPIKPVAEQADADIAAAIARGRGLSKMSAKAVGQSVGWNPICIIIPCHRVVGAGGAITGYGGGLHNKVALLEMGRRGIIILRRKA